MEVEAQPPSSRSLHRCFWRVHEGFGPEAEAQAGESGTHAPALEAATPAASTQHPGQLLWHWGAILRGPCCAATAPRAPAVRKGFLPASRPRAWPQASYAVLACPAAFVKRPRLPGALGSRRCEVRASECRCRCLRTCDRGRGRSVLWATAGAEEWHRRRSNMAVLAQTGSPILSRAAFLHLGAPSSPTLRIVLSCWRPRG